VYAPWYHGLQRFFQRARHAGASIPVVFAAPDRAHEEYHRVMKRRLQGKGRPSTPQQLSDRAPHAPFISIWMPSPKFNPDLYNPSQVVVGKDIQKGTAQVMRWPRPMRSTVQADLWASVEGGEIIAQNIEGQIELQFAADKAFLPVDWSNPRWYRPPFNVLEHAKVLGPTRITLVNQGWDDNSELEPGDGEKVVRRTWSGEVLGYIPYPPQEARLVRTVRFALYDATDEDNPELLAEQVSGSED